ncbi:MFS transporter, putative [Cordyceps militaris CM01]|uniref:MFS transporter, putative n=2 Tax=Cordyceps militaris TaxID=73501 RepID=G3J2Y8_CORMM|nr:MFS transporter, putative [Cordyceps militaris CM01]ATY66550.1 Major facilitator superfamily general substrate transporter [Cordyceps militaris]EGX97267.1 MFS transporter, putative [Cordyceps militaris CM01]
MATTRDDTPQEGKGLETPAAPSWNLNARHQPAAVTMGKEENTDIEKAKPATPEGPPAGGGGFGGFPVVQYPTGFPLYANIISLYLASFLTALDRTIVVNAIPTITNEFNSVGDISWYGSSYLITFCAFQLVYGKIYAYYNAKWVFLSAVGIFLVGSAICGAAQSSVTLIVGRAVAGLGSSGIFGGSVIITFFTVPLKMRPIYSGVVSFIFAVASIVGPLIGGALTQHGSWRWCFFLNLPVGALTIVVTLLVLKLPPAKKAGTPWKAQIKSMDPIGNLFFVPGIVCLLLALQWGGSEYSWSNGRIIALLVLAALLLVAFMFVQWWQKDNATVPLRVILERNMAAACLYTAFVAGSMMSIIYYLPVWFQAIKAASPTRSGVMMLALVVPSGVSGLVSGFAVSKAVGYYAPFMLACTALMAIGAGLLTTLTPHSSDGTWIGYQVIWGFGSGLGMTAGGLVPQTVLARMDAPIGISLIFFSQSLGGSVFLSACQSVFGHLLKTGLRGLTNSSDILNSGSTDLRKHASLEELPALLDAYNNAVTKTLVIGAATAAAAFAAALAVEWKSVRKAQDQNGPPGLLGGKPAPAAGPMANTDAPAPNGAAAESLGPPNGSTEKTDQ